MEEVNAVPLVGGPLVAGVGFVVLLLLAFTGTWATALVTIAHEGGHYAVALLMGYSPSSLRLEDNGDGGTGYDDDWWSPGRILRRAAGYATPPLLGLGGALLVARGQAWSVLWVEIVLLLAAFLVSTNLLAITVSGLALLGFGWAALAAGPQVQAGVAVGLVWLLLLGGLLQAIGIPRSNDSTDIANLQRDTLLVPRIVWHAAFTALAVYCAWVGGRALLGF